MERRAAEQRAARAAKKGLTLEETPDSQVGERRYARGRAYVADRYFNPAEAEEKTAAALAESEEYEQEQELLAQEDAAVTQAEAPAVQEPENEPEDAPETDADEPEEPSDEVADEPEEAEGADESDEEPGE